MLLNKPRTLERSQVLMWIVILDLTMNVKNLKIINTIEVKTDVPKLVPKLHKSGEVPQRTSSLRTYSHDEPMVINQETRINQMYRILPFGAISEIRSLKLNCKKRILNNMTLCRKL